MAGRRKQRARESTRARAVSSQPQSEPPAESPPRDCDATGVGTVKVSGWSGAQHEAVSFTNLMYDLLSDMDVMAVDKPESDAKPSSPPSSPTRVSLGNAVREVPSGTLYFSNEDASHGCMGAHLLMGHRNKRVCLDKDVPAAPAEGTPQDLVVGVGLHLDSISIPPRIKAAEKEARDFKYRQALAGFFAGMATTPSKPSANPRKPSAAIEQAACSRAAMAQLQAPAKSQLINAVSKFISKRTSTSDEMDPANSSLAVLAHAMRPIDVALQDLEAVAPGAGVNKAEAFLAKHNVSAESLMPYVNATSKADEAMDCDGDNATSLQEGSSHQVEADASALAPAADEDAAPAEVEDVLARGAARVAPMYRRRQLAKAAAFRGVADPTNPEAQRIMKNWFFEHFGNPYPTEAERRELALRTNLTVDQVTNWFINQRGRIWKPLVTQLDAELVNEDAAEITTITTRTNKLVNEDADAHSGGAASG